MEMSNSREKPIIQKAVDKINNFLKFICSTCCDRDISNIILKETA